MAAASVALRAAFSSPLQRKGTTSIAPAGAAIQRRAPYGTRPAAPDDILLVTLLGVTQSQSLLLQLQMLYLLHLFLIPPGDVVPATSASLQIVVMQSACTPWTQSGPSVNALFAQFAGALVDAVSSSSARRSALVPLRMAQGVGRGVDLPTLSISWS